MSTQVSFLHALEPLSLDIPSYRTRAFHACFRLRPEDIPESALSISTPSVFPTWRHTRQAEFIAGRYLAQQALQQLGAEHTHLHYEPQRAPVWPEGFSGSISHKREQVAVWVCADEEQLLGLDLELWMPEHKAHTLAPRIMTQSEMKRLDDNDIAFLCTLTFSAKESLFKALHPAVQIFFGFQEAEIVALDLNQHTFTLELLCDLTSDWHAGRQVHGRWQSKEDHIITAIHIAPI